MAQKKRGKSVSVHSTQHKDKRKNIPTEELRGFVKEDELKPKEVNYPGLLYARDPSLDPQLVWKGKDEQDREELTVPSVPIYIQEKIHPHAIIEDVRAQAKKGKGEQLDFFADFNGLPEDFDKRVDFYHWEGNWSNRMILGDSLLVMTSLAEKEGLKGQVQMIYIDPPYGVQFNSNWQVSTRKREVKDGQAKDMTRQPEQIRAFRDTWKLEIHSYLAYWRDRLVAARELLTETGSVFVQISDDNAHLVRSIMDEVFGSDNYAGTIPFFKTSSQSTNNISSIVDYLVIYAKNANLQKWRPLLRLKQPGEIGAKQYVYLVSPDLYEMRKMTEEELKGEQTIPVGWKVCRPGPTTSQGYQENRSSSYVFQNETFTPSSGRHWSYEPSPRQEMDRLARIGRIRKSGKGISTILLAEDNPTTPLDNVWMDTGTGSFTEEQIYVVQTGTKVIERCILMATDPGDLVLDPTCGSGTTAYATEKWARRWITVDTSRVALALARTRLMTARYPYYLLSDSPEGVKKEAEITGRIPPPYPTGGDIKKGFVYKRARHVTLGTIAKDEEINTIYEKWQRKLEPIRKQLNKLLKKSFEGWQIPREAEKDWPKEAKNLHKQWWDIRLRRQKEIDESIARNTDTELLYDRPYEDNKRIRVSGSFTVESLSPHRTISFEDKKQLTKPDGQGWTIEMMGAGQFGNIIIENLKKAGVQNTIKNERLKFDRLEVHPGVWIHAEGEYTEKDGKSKRVAVCIGPEHGTVGPELVKEAAKEAVQGIGYDLLLVCGFAFDPHVSEEAKRYGELTVLPTRINADLQMGDEFLKKTGSGNLFVVFGEPDLEVKKTKDGEVQVEIKGLDIYDPTTGEIRNNSTDDIACWFIDTNYNGESFFVRHAYFTGADNPYDKLKRALRAEINEEAWSMLYSTTSRPFAPPETGKIAVKVINHYGDEVLKVYEVDE